MNTTYQHNRSAPGNICDCGHSACYHSQHNNDGKLSPDRVVGALVEKVKNLEELVIKERESRVDQMSRERQRWEREVMVLREALAPFYHTEADLKRRLLELKDKVDSTYEEQCRLKERVVTIDDASITLERRVEDCVFSYCRKRKASLGHDEVGVMSPESNYTYSGSSASDATSVAAHISPQPPSPLNPALPGSINTDSPRSSSVLLLSSAARQSEGNHAYVAQHKRQSLGFDHEPRSSGFLSIDLAERLRDHKFEPPQHRNLTLSATTRVHQAPVYMTGSGLPSPPHPTMPFSALPVLDHVNGMQFNLESHSSKKLKHHGGEMTGLELLANVASPLAQQS
ncbi:hypothetical protein PMZ80_002269 [Knufia obscura]|uniref:Uncharacterized protein n=2 Tax=Knufia TaxID=430999 RepID=A0AAN8EB15_9EURO|nr:hypothetical protein PMZ80_002269 [Knufia obscura]KAK5950628.1 hypothetical protein OHC33_008294 [Knufia fluminis]